MRIRAKIHTFFACAVLALTALLIGSAIHSFNLYSAETERGHARLAAELVRTELMFRFMDGNLENTDLLPYLTTIIPDLHSVRVVRTPAVIRQYGPGEEKGIREIEKRALASRQPIGKLVENDQGTFFQYVAPYFAETTGQRNCLKCHDVPQGTALGAVNLRLDLSQQQAAVLGTTARMVVLTVSLALLLAYLLHRLLWPVVKATGAIHDVVARATHGDFSGCAKVRSRDELGAVTEQTNRLMATLQQAYGSIIDEVQTVSVGHRHRARDENLLSYAQALVCDLTDAARFRKTIESDRNLSRAYARLERALIDRFALARFCMYEVLPDTDRLSPVFARRSVDDSELWCSAEILTDSNECRAKRTGQEISSIDRPGICSAYCGNGAEGDEQLLHVCTPLVAGGGIRGVLQILLSRADSASVQEKLHNIKRYVEEAAPVIESRRLLRVLEESTLRDSLTGLHNRRFLEQIIDKLVAVAERRDEKIAVLMCDLDSFKETNDSYGHHAGDKVLAKSARIISNSVRVSDFVIRLGGDEFLVILMDAEASRAMETAERMRASIEATLFENVFSTIKGTLSVGVAVYPDDAASVRNCIKHADLALYRAKAAGRNRVVRFSAEVLHQRHKRFKADPRCRPECSGNESAREGDSGGSRGPKNRTDGEPVDAALA